MKEFHEWLNRLDGFVTWEAQHGELDYYYFNSEYKIHDTSIVVGLMIDFIKANNIPLHNGNLATDFLEFINYKEENVFESISYIIKDIAKFRKNRKNRKDG